jgi:hypothetical protein
MRRKSVPPVQTDTVTMQEVPLPRVVTCFPVRWVKCIWCQLEVCLERMYYTEDRWWNDWTGTRGRYCCRTCARNPREASTRFRVDENQEHLAANKAPDPEGRIQ